MIANRPTGATSLTRKNPNSRSQAIGAAGKMAVDARGLRQDAG
jgi:hypothetical protein